MDEHKKIVQYCVNSILGQTKRPLLVAITGESGSGKSYFTKDICKELEDREVKYTFVNHDDFLIPRKEREALRERVYEGGEFKEKTYWEVLENWYYLDGFQALLDHLQSGKKFQYHPYIHATGEISSELKIIDPEQIVILENKLFLDQMDFVIELEVDRKGIIERKIERDSDVRTPEQTIEMHEKAQGYFWDRCKPLHADIIIDNNDYHHPYILK